MLCFLFSFGSVKEHPTGKVLTEIFKPVDFASNCKKNLLWEIEHNHLH